MHDLVIVPGGGLRPSGELPPWFRSRLDRALEVSAGSPILCLSNATPHRPPPLDRTGRGMVEAVEAARYLVARGVSPARLYTECTSLDTVGNAFFARTCHTDLREWRRLLIVNSDFHLPRTEAIFRWVFGLAPDRGYELEFETSPGEGLTGEDLAFRVAREARSLETVRELERRIRTLGELHRFLFHEHEAYALPWVLTPREASEELGRVY